MPSRLDKREIALNHRSSLQGVLNWSRLEKGNVWRLHCLPVIPFLKFLFWMGVQLIYSAVLVSGVWPSESVYTHTYIHSFLRLLSHIGHDKVLSALCYTVDPVSFFFFLILNQIISLSQGPQICRWHYPYGRRTKEPLDGSERGEWKSWMKVKEESEKVGLKFNIQKTKIMASGPITSWEIDRETVSDFIFFWLQNHCRWWLQLWN